jgi:hypothetical protein
MPEGSGDGAPARAGANVEICAYFAELTISLPWQSWPKKLFDAGG